MKKVEVITTLWHWRQVIQLESDPVGMTFAAYAGVLEENESLDMYDSLNGRGNQGLFLPDNRKQVIHYNVAVEYFPYFIERLELTGYVWRQ